ncbi:MAG: YibE/F family protein [Clostridia bacterium]|nr:YibE/F family protein [Clostridia bacterium]
MKKIFLILASILLITSFFNISLATDEETTYLYTNDSGELVESDNYDLDKDAVLIDGEEDYNDLLNNTNTSSNQEDLKKAFDAQKKELANYTSDETNQKFIITNVISDIKSEYTTDYYYYYVIKYQVATIRTADGKESPAVVILSYDVSDNKSIKPLKTGDTMYGFVEFVSNEDSTYNMVNHGLTDREIAYVSISHQDRTLGMVLLVAFTILLLLLYAGKKGAKLLIPLFVAIDLLFIVFVPELELGRNLLILASFIAFELIILIAVLKNGWSRKTIVAIISSIIVVILITTLGILFGNANGFTGKGIIVEENYDLLSNVYYIDTLFKSTIGTYDLYIAIIILITSVISASIASKIVDLSEKYAGSEGMINNIIEEAKSIIAEYPMMIAIIFLVLYVPNYMTLLYNHPAYESLINAESLVSYLTIGLMAIISSLVISPITAIISYILMGKVEIKQISE